MRLGAVGVESGTFQVVNIEIEEITGGDPVVKDFCLDNILRGEDIQSLEVAGFANPDNGGVNLLTLYVTIA